MLLLWIVLALVGGYSYVTHIWANRFFPFIVTLWVYLFSLCSPIIIINMICVWLELEGGRNVLKGLVARYDCTCVAFVRVAGFYERDEKIILHSN